MTVIQEKTETIVDLEIFRKSAFPDDGPTLANVILIHGIGEHIGRYRHVIDAFTKNQFAIQGFDLPGHGKSSGKRGSLDYCEVWKIINHIKEEPTRTASPKPLFLYGHSMGGAIVLSYCYRFPEHLTGAIVTSPGLRTGKVYPNFAVNLLEKAARKFPNFSIINGLPLSGLSHDPQVERDYRADPLVHNRVTLRLGIDLIRQGQALLKEKTDFPLPLLLFQGENDSLVDPAATSEFAKKIGTKGIYHLIQGGYHELHNEPDQETYLNQMSDWMMQLI